MSDLTAPKAWLDLRRYTQARIGLGRCGDSLPTHRLLEVGLAQARARDAVQQALDVPALQQRLAQAGFESLSVHSAAADRQQYLQRPDSGRRLSAASRALLAQRGVPTPPELLFVLADGLSALAVMHHALPLLEALRPLLAQRRLAPIVLAEQARVALGDEIGELWRCELAIMLIGERPGLSAPDSLGVYLTYGPRVGRRDAERNCISNIRAQGLDYVQAAATLQFLIEAARRGRGSGVALKDERELAAQLPAVDCARKEAR